MLALLMRQDNALVTHKSLYRQVVRRLQKSPERELLLSAVARECIIGCMLTAVSASIIQAKCQGRDVRILGHPSAYAPSNSAFFLSVFARLSQLNVPAVVLADLQAFYARASFARSASEYQFSSSGMPSRQSDGELSVLQEVWRHACRAALVAIQSLQENEIILCSGHNQDIRDLRDALTEICCGETPFVRTDDTAFIPGWLDIRRSERRNLGWIVTIGHKDGRASGVLENISQSGMGFTSPKSIASGSPISVELPDGRILHGAVVWKIATRYGAELFHPIPDHDPVFRE